MERALFLVEAPPSYIYCISFLCDLCTEKLNLEIFCLLGQLQQGYRLLLDDVTGVHFLRAAGVHSGAEYEPRLLLVPSQERPGRKDRKSLFGEKSGTR